MSRRKLDEIARKAGYSGQRAGGKGLRQSMRTDWANLAREYKEFPGSMGPFHRHLCEAIMTADKGNTERLRKAYPELVKELKD